MRTVPVHNLRPNETTWTPPAVAYFDTETRWTMIGDDESHELRCWAASLTVRRDARKKIERHASDHGLYGSDLALTISAWAGKHRSLWIYAHNLSFDLTTSAVTTHLAALGWQVTEFALDSPSPFVRMTNGRSRITFSDSFSWLPGKLEEVAAASDTAKVPLPANDAPVSQWLRRCTGDVGILADAMNAIMAWWDNSDLGRWSVTGSAAGWNAMRHKINAARFTVNPDPKGIAADRDAIYGGRRGVWRYGKLKPGNYTELDFQTAYGVIAANMPLPHERMASFTSLPLDHRWLTSDRHGVIARVRLRTDTPRWPVRLHKRVWYPVGEFWTTLAGPDIAEAARLGCLLEVGAGYVHRLGYALKPWADWCLGLARGEDPAAPPVARIWGKHCCRAVIGKWAQRGFSTIEIGPSPEAGWHASEGWNHTRNCRAVIIDFDGRRWQASASGDGDNCYPAVLAYVESYVRVMLGRVIEEMPDSAMVSCDTDGVIVDNSMLAGFRISSGPWNPLLLRVKNTYHTGEMIGPQHMTLGDTRRYAGVPKGAEPTGDGRLVSLTWPKIIWQMGNSSQGIYYKPQQSYRIPEVQATGWVLDTGRVVPVEVTVDGDGVNSITPWNVTGYALSGAKLGEHQNKILRGYEHGSKT